jgi:hypothetical protein
VGKPLVSPGEFDINQHAYSSEKSWVDDMLQSVHLANI